MPDWLILGLIGLVVIRLLTRRRRRSKERRRAPERRPSRKRREETDAPPPESGEAYLFREAFDKVIAGVDAPAALKSRARRAYLAAARTGNPRLEGEALQRALTGAVWGEKYFGEWRRRFERDGAFPYMWERHPDLCSGPPPPPSSTDEALDLLKVHDMRALVRRLDIAPEGRRPRTRQEFVDLLSRAELKDAVVRAAAGRHDERLERHALNRDAAKCEILAHTVGCQEASLRRLRRRRSYSGKPRLMTSTCPVETKYGRKFAFGSLARMPPFFPGDRSCVM